MGWGRLLNTKVLSVHMQKAKAFSLTQSNQGLHRSLTVVYEVLSCVGSCINAWQKPLLDCDVLLTDQLLTIYIGPKDTFSRGGGRG